MNCKRCNEELRDDWNYCPKCGERTRPMNPMPMPLMANVTPFRGGAIKINIVRNSSPNFQNQGVANQRIEEAPMKTYSEVIEPESELVQDKEGVKVQIKLPGVKKIDDIILKKVGESLEVNAYTGDKRYFKIVNLEKLNILKKEFTSEVLTLLLG
ncbi:Uncharacterised protein [Candidatus Tiddalikarchaeum anstoanum]|nr:Uncharacterised protein [Candidatus Tiddalikarchaeum anstoanum]